MTCSSRRWFDHRGQLRHGGHRVSRHYYDVFRLLQSQTGQSAATDRQLAEDCARHARMFFNTPDFDLNEAAHGTIRRIGVGIGDAGTIRFKL